MSLTFYIPDSFTFNDDFTGVNGDPPNSERWDIIGDSADVFIQDNQLRTQVAGTSETNGVASLFKISGDFILQADFDFDTGYGTGTDHSPFFTVQYVGEALQNAVRIYLNTFSEYKFIMQRWINGSFGSAGGPTQQTSGTFRISRTGSLWQAAVDTGSGFVNIGSTVGIGPNDVEVSLTNSVWGNVTLSKVDWDNWTIAEGTASLI